MQDFFKRLFASEDTALIGGGIAAVVNSGFDIHGSALWAGLGMIAKGLISVIFGAKA